MLVMTGRVMNPFIRDDLPSPLFSEVPTCGKPQISASLRSCDVIPRPGGPAVSQFPSSWWVVLQKGLIINRSLVQPRSVVCCVCSVIQSCSSLCNPMDYNLPCSSVHGIFQARILDWVAISSPRGSSRPMSPPFPALAGEFFTTVPPGKPRLQKSDHHQINNTFSLSQVHRARNRV